MSDPIKMINKIKKVFIPGPVDPLDEVKKASSTSVFSHRSEEFSLLYNNIEKLMKPIVGASEKCKVILMPGSSTLGIESVFINILTPKDRVLVIKHGFFGTWMEEIVKRYTSNVDSIEAPLGSVSDPDIVVDKIKEGGYDVVGVVHYETSAGTAVRYLDKIGKAAAETGSIVIVDGVSSVGAEEIKMDEWGLGAIVTGPQKCLGAYPGLSIIALDKKMVDLIYEKKDKVKTPFYMDLCKYIEYKDKYGWTVTTPPINNVVSLYVSLKKIHDYGVKNYFELHKERAKEVYSYAEEKGLKPLVKDESIRAYSVAVIEVNGAKNVVKKLKEKYGFVIATGLGEYADKLVRIGMMGFALVEDLKKVIDYIKDLA
ncbi:alanine--glyoxylate aminotransferase family protein [Desulfurococcaceae archaeon MEX13E-LK6-19]|nr:alanine--glyoxylate aminotransferase family protein [Desulfurococcaceae archaeon MEX13E-LK6-19]